MSAPETFPSYRARYLPALRADEIAALSTPEKAVVVVPTGAVEQHGPHLPAGVDSLMGQAWLDYALPKLPESCPVYVAPPITIGKSNEHTGFPGTLMISKDTLRAQLLAIGHQLHRWGFRTMAILNTHGGNSAVVRTTLRELRASPGLRCAMLRFGTDLGLDAQETTYGFHANTAETAWMLEIMDGACIDMSLAPCEYPARVDDPGELRPECAPAIFSWVSSDLSKSGTMGDATAATREKGRAWMEAMSTRLAEVLEKLCAQTAAHPPL